MRARISFAAFTTTCFGLLLVAPPLGAESSRGLVLEGQGVDAIPKRASSATRRKSKQKPAFSGQEANTILMLVDEQKKAADFARDTLARFKETRTEALASDEGQLLRQLMTARGRVQLEAAAARLGIRLGHDREKVEDALFDWQEVIAGERRMPGAKPEEKAETPQAKLAEVAEIARAMHLLDKEHARNLALHRRIVPLMSERVRNPLRLEQVFADHPWALRAARSLYRPMGKPERPIVPRVLAVDERGRVLFESVDIAVVTPLDKDRVLMTSYHDETTVPAHRLHELREKRAEDEGRPVAKEGGEKKGRKEKTGIWVASETTLVDRTRRPRMRIDARDVLNNHNRARLYGRWQNELQFEPAVHLHNGEGNHLKMIHLNTGKTESMFTRPLEFEALGKAGSKDIGELLRLADKAASRQISVPVPWHDEAPTPKALLKKSGVHQSYTRQVTPQRGRIVTKH